MSFEFHINGNQTTFFILFVLRSCTFGFADYKKCPVSGVWKVDGFPTTTAPIAKGNTMPPYCGKAVTWRLIQYA